MRTFLRLGLRPRSGKYLLNVYSVINVQWRIFTPLLSIADFFDENPEIFSFFLKFFLRLILGIKKRLSSLLTE